MKARVESARETLRQRSRLALALFGVALVVLVVFVPGSVANLAPSTFEGNDGNMVHAAGTDWDNTPGPVLSLTDTPAGNTDNAFKGGTKEDDTAVQIDDGSIPNKDDFDRAYVAKESVNGNSYLYLAWVRSASNGDAHIDFELDQNSTPGWDASTPNGTIVNINRTVGDLLISYDFGGSGTPTITSFTWDGSHWGNQKDLSASGFAEAGVNTSGSVTDTVAGGTLPAKNFGEASINLTAALDLPKDKPCETFGAVFVKSRSSGDGGSSTVKDYIAPAPLHVSTCGSIVLKKHWEGKAGSTTLDVGTTAGGSDVATKTVTADGATDAKDVVPGTYYVGESPNPPTNFSASAPTCFNDKNANGTQDDGEAVSVGQDGSVSLATNDLIVCSITNTYTKASPTIATTLSKTSVTVGGSVSDSAAFTGFRSPATGGGTVTYTVYTDSSCTQNARGAGTVNVAADGTVPSSNALQFDTAGDYYWQASFSGNDDNNAATSVCTEEHLVVAKAAPSLTTTASGPVTVGSAIHDTAHLTGGFNPTGTITFQVFGPGDTTCATPLAPAPASATVNGNGNYDSGDFTASTAGDYRWIAHYSGDSNNQAFDTKCNDADETSTVNKATPSIATQLSSESVTVGAAVHDSSTLSNATPSAGGTVTYSVYTNNTCSSLLQTAGTKTVTSGVVPDSDPVTFDDSGDYYWQASYSGDGNNASAVSPCQSEHLVVAKADTTTDTQIHDGSHSVVTTAPLGATVHDRAVVSASGTSLTPAGNVTFTWFANGTCTGAGTAAGTVALAGGVAHPSTSEGPLGAGSYSFKAHYAGNANFNASDGPCEALTVAKADSTTDTQVHDASHSVVTTVPLGTTVHDRATVTDSNAQFDPTGNVTFTFFANGTCDGAGTAAGTVALAGGAAHPSSAEGPLQAGSYSFRAHYAGDDNFNASDGPCEGLTVNKASTSTATDVHNAAHSAITQAALGATVHDSASVSSANTSFPVGGNVTFTFFANGTCTGAGTDAGTVAVSGGVAHPSGAEGPLEAGSYSFQAVYAGDSNFTGSTGPCEPLTVSKASTTTATDVHNDAHSAITQAALGATVHDSASVSSANQSFPVTGDVSFTWFANGACTGAGTDAGTVALAGGVAHPSSSEGPLGAGSYSFRAVYAGDSNFTGSTGPCEALTVDKAQLGISTKVHDGLHNDVTGQTVPLGSMVHDTANVTGGVQGFPVTGAVTYALYSLANCQGPATVVAADGTDSQTGDVRSVDSLTLLTGSYGFVASVAGDDNYVGKTGVCEPFSVNVATTTTVTAIHDAQHDVVTTVPLGSVVHDAASVSSGNGATKPTGDVSFTFFANGTCTGPGTAAGTVTLDQNGVAHASSPEGPLAAGSYSFQATYAGDGNFSGSTGDCEPLTVSKADSSTATDVHDAAHSVITQAALGSTVHDSAAVTSANKAFPVTGTVSFTFYANGTCTSTGSDAGTVALSSGTADPSSAEGPLAAGSYSFRAHYNGDSNFNGSDGPCEPLTIDKAASTTDTQVHDAQHGVVTSVALGSTVHDRATVTDANPSFDPTGDVAFTFFANGTCDGAGADAGTAALASGAAHPSSPEGPLAAGSYSFRAHYEGDSNFAGSDGPCEALTVSKADTSTATDVHNAAHQAITQAALGSTVHDSASVTSANQSFPVTGSVSFTFYANDSCSDSGAAAGSASLAAGVADGSSAEGPLAAGRYSFKAVYAGDSNFNGSTGPCEPLTIDKGDSATGTQIHDAQHGVVTAVPLGATVHDLASVTDANASFDPTGDVSFRFFTNGSCSGDGSSAGTVALSGGVAHPSDSEGPLATGSYSFRAHYAGDSNFNASDGPCEQLGVGKSDTTTTTDVHDGSHHVVTAVALGSSVHDSASVSSANQAFPVTGSVSFTFYSSVDCSGEGSAAGSASLSGGVADGSSTEGPLAAGAYSFRAVYGGDENFNGSTGPCEPLTVAKADSSTATTIHDAGHDPVTEVLIGSTVHDGASVTSANTSFKPAGNASFTFFANGTCTGEGTAAGTVALDGNGVAHPSTAEGPLNTAGLYGFKATYAGDSNFNGSTGPCEVLQVDRPAIAITKSPATQAIDSGGTASFTILVTNTGTVTLTNVTVTDPLSANCAKTVGTLTPGQSTSYTCSRSGVTDPFTNVATATGHPPVGPDVTASASANVTINTPPSSPPSATPTVDLAIVKTVDRPSVVQGANVTYTLTVTNNGPVTDTNVKVADPLPFGVGFVSVSSSQGTCTQASGLVSCSLGTMTSGQKVTVTIVAGTVGTGAITNTATVVGDLPETTTANNTSSVGIDVTAPPKAAPKPVFKPPVAPKPKPKPRPVVKPKPKPKPVVKKPTPPPCYAVVVAPKSLTVGKGGNLRLHVTAKQKPIAGVRVEIRGPGILKLSGRTNKAGKVSVSIHPRKPGIVTVKPAAYKGCSAPRIGVIAAFTPPVTG